MRIDSQVGGVERTSSKGGFASIEGLRGWMAWWVVIGHAIYLSGANKLVPGRIAQWSSRVDIAVNVFIIVSGFVITHMIYVKKERYLPYLVRRIFRIVPIYYVCLVFSVLTTAWYAEAFVDLPWAALRDMRADQLAQVAEERWPHFALHALLLHGIIPDEILKFSSSSLLGPAWSLSLEWQFYLVAPLIVLPMMSRFRSAIAITALLLFLGVVSHQYGTYRFPSMLLLSIHYFLVGIWSRIVLAHWRIETAPHLVLAPFFLAALALGSSEMAIWTLFLAFALTERREATASRSSWFGWIMFAAGTNRLIRYLGKVSYSTYLVHVPLFATVVHFYSASIGIHTQGDMLLAIALSVLAVLIASPILYRGIEKPFLDLGARIANGRAAIPGPTDGRLPPSPSFGGAGHK